jgi:hypothetical protein
MECVGGHCDRVASEVANWQQIGRLIRRAETFGAILQATGGWPKPGILFRISDAQHALARCGVADDQAKMVKNATSRIAENQIKPKAV